ncbi:HPF/RaiA family ribosome-associated protein [Rhodococcus marinonascens]|uniref:HPF/RaiA family ribosome-associated protein n=1 Tax=Rhodococcus marinonascens TaxID=38311 RepID=UPI000AB93C98|nr:HPF/RaiA family ribosome-associated protein [Rhodococcus marinonascens]
MLVHIQINTDGNFDDSFDDNDELVRRAESEIASVLERFTEQITRVEVHLSDENAGKGAPADKRCMLEARPAGQPPVAVTNHATTTEEAYSGAAHKLASLLNSRFGRLNEAKGGTSIRGHDTV